MEQFNLYVHGVPIGHEICGCDEELDYIKEFYNHDKSAKASSLLQIDVVSGSSFYTYLRSKNVRNAQGRPGSYLGLTVSFRGSYCTNVERLYAILEAIYKQVCVGCLITADAGGERFLVKEIERCAYKSHPIVDYIKSAFKQNLEILRFERLDGFANSVGEGERFSLKEVDSPLFNETLKRKRILVSPEYETANVAYKAALNELNPLKAECKELKQTNAQLSESNRRLTEEVADLERKLGRAATSAGERYKTQIEELKAKYAASEKERQKLAEKINEATSAVDLMNEPFKKLARLTASQFREDDEKSGKNGRGIPHPKRKEPAMPVWIPCCALVLLLLAVGLCGYGCYTVSQLSKTVEMIQQKAPADDDDEDARTLPDNGEGETDSHETEEEKHEGQPSYDDFKSCRIDVSPSPGNALDKFRTYTLSVVKKANGQKANVPVGVWEAAETPPVHITGNTFQVDSSAAPDTNVQIYYTVNGKHELTRTLKIK